MNMLVTFINTLYSQEGENSLKTEIRTFLDVILRYLVDSVGEQKTIKV